MKIEEDHRKSDPKGKWTINENDDDDEMMIAKLRQLLYNYNIMYK